jgi:hypothetical protein
MKFALRELQENFQAYVLNQDSNIISHISTQALDASKQIDIYKKGYSLRLLEILQKDFPILYQKAGEELFNKFGYDYIKTYPSNHFNICIFSRHFSQFLIAEKHEPFLAEMAAFEWALSRALDTADAPHIGLPDLSNVLPESWPYVQFCFHSSVALYEFHFNSPQIVYAMMLENDSIPEPAKEQSPRGWVIWRFELQPYFESLSKEQAWMVNAILQKKTFGEICQGLCEWLPEEEVAMYAAGSLKNWLEKGMFSEFKVAKVTEEALETMEAAEV